MSRLVAVSNRVGPVRGAPLAGGLAVALVDALKEYHGLWFGWSGCTLESDAELPPPVLEQGEGLTLALQDLNARDFDDYYNGFANRCLWPLVHFRLDLTSYDDAHYQAYNRVNRRFAEALLPLLEPDDLIWVHDYHLFPMASFLREHGCRQRIGFFLHTPFPPPDILTALPQHEALVRALFDYDVVGLQIEDDVRRLRDYVIHTAGGQGGADWLQAFGRRIRVGAFPVGIDAQRYHEFAFSPRGEREFRQMRTTLRGRDQIIGVDRLDYSKGLLRRMNAYELLLERYPETHSRIEFMQIAPISRGDVKAYQDFRGELEQAAAHINGRFAQLDWTPVHYLNRTIPRRQLAGLYRASRIGLVTPMRDGMNLVAKEYVAAQDAEDPGVLVLSRFAGAAKQMQAALQVNPYDTAEVAMALARARIMSAEERRERHAALMKGLLEDDIATWRKRFIEAMKSGGGR